MRAPFVAGLLSASHGLEGPEIVWFKIKSRTYTQGEGRWELFQRDW
jgi:hypothetical protein